MTMSPKKVLLTSPVQPIAGCSPDVYSWNKRPGAIRLFLCFLNHPGLGFLKANLPVDILEYPSQAQFDRALETRPDILGISFYINETEIALRMAEQARARGVREIWAGNYGGTSPQIAAAFDRVFKGWSEVAIAQQLGLPKQPLRHPELYGVLGCNLSGLTIISGTLYTSRGCPWTCNFCQTPDFYGKAHPIPLEELERIVRVYKERGTHAINILDENFGTFKQHARQVVEMLHRHQMRWIALTRVDTLSENFDHWQPHGLIGAHVGVESLNAASLEGAKKRVDQACTVDLLRRLSRHNLFVQAFYIIGFEEDTVASIRRDITELAQLDVDLVHVQVLTPYPGTLQRAMIEQKYGIFDHNLSKYNSRNLVWNHPNITPEEMKALQLWADQQLSTSRRALRSLAKIVAFGGTPHLSLKGVGALRDTMRPAARALKTELKPRLDAAYRWAQGGWAAAYEEVPAEASYTARPTEGYVRPVVSAGQASATLALDR
jgi:hypothetical protein